MSWVRVPSTAPHRLSVAPDSQVEPSFGDHVRIIEHPATLEAGIAGLDGDVLGETTPLVTGVEAVGGAPQEFAILVDLVDFEDDVWINPELVEFLDHSPGMEIQYKGVNKRWIRSETGAWVEEPLEEPRRPWWRFW